MRPSTDRPRLRVALLAALCCACFALRAIGVPLHLVMADHTALSGNGHVHWHGTHEHGHHHEGEDTEEPHPAEDHEQAFDDLGEPKSKLVLAASLPPTGYATWFLPELHRSSPRENERSPRSPPPPRLAPSRAPPVVA